MCQAQNPTPTPCRPDEQPASQPPEETLAAAFQPRAYAPNDQTMMHRIRFRPSSGGPKWPTVLMLPPTVFRYEIVANGSPSERVATRDLVDAGFLVFQIEHRLAPQGLLFHQKQHDNTPEGIASGRPPQQTDDVKQQILAALDDSECNGKIFLVGGSSGGCHALWVALDPTTGNITGWNSDVVAHIKAVVSLSGPTELGSRVHDEDDPIEGFIESVENYTHTYNDPNWYSEQQAVSPITLVANATYIPPTRLYATEDDTVPHQQGEDMRTTLQDKGADVAEYTMDGSAHAFNYWHLVNSVTQGCVSQEVIDFLNAHKNDP